VTQLLYSLLLLSCFYYIDKSVLVENRPLVMFMRNYVRDSSGVFSISSLVRISMTSFPAFTLLFGQKISLRSKRFRRAFRSFEKFFAFWLRKNWGERNTDGGKPYGNACYAG